MPKLVVVEQRSKDCVTVDEKDEASNRSGNKQTLRLLRVWVVEKT